MRLILHELLTTRVIIIL